MPEKITKIGHGFRVTLPKQWRTKNNVKSTDFIKFQWDYGYGGNELRIIPISVEIKEKRD